MSTSKKMDLYHLPNEHTWRWMYIVNDLRLLETDVRRDSIKHKETSPSIVNDSNLARNPIQVDLPAPLFPSTGFLNLWTLLNKSL